MFNCGTRFKNPVLYLLLLVGPLFFSCGSDRQGDEIGALKNTDFPETYTVRSNEIFVAQGVHGPEDKSTFAAHNITQWQKYSQGALSRLAILLTDTNASWLGLAHGLKSVGVPFIITTDYKKALEHRVVLVYPVISGAALSQEALQALAAFPRNGGTLIGTQVLGALNEVFGFTEPIPSKQHFEIHFPNDTNNILSGEFTDPRELQISIGNQKKFKETIGTYSYSKTTFPPVATYEDKSVAISMKLYEVGKAYAIGFDLGYLILKGHNIRHEQFNRSAINDFEPTVDVILRLLRNIYLANDRNAAFVCTVPYNKDLTVCVTHNINFKNALNEAIDFAKEEKAMGLHSSYFVQTKYIRDQSSSIFNSEDDFKKLRTLTASLMDIESNSVSGSPLFDQFEQGTGDEVYPDYRPYVMAYEKSYHGSVFGELRVSRFLLDRYIPGNNTSCFRSAYLYTPFFYPQSLIASGYRFSSSVPANACLSHYPFQMNFNREYDCEVDAFEFPVTDDDEIPPYSLVRASHAIALAQKISSYGGCFIGQVHPNALGMKVEKEFYKAMRQNAWFGTLRDFGLWWAARNEITLDVNNEGGRRVVILNVPKRMEGLAIMLPIRSTPIAVDGATKYSVDGKLIIFELAEGLIRITLNN